jgi:hypothetical protein
VVFRRSDQLLPRRELLEPLRDEESLPDFRDGGEAERVGVDERAGVAERVGVDERAGVAERVGVDERAGVAERVGVERVAGRAERLGVVDRAGVADRVGTVVRVPRVTVRVRESSAGREMVDRVVRRAASRPTAEPEEPTETTLRSLNEPLPVNVLRLPTSVPLRPPRSSPERPSSAFRVMVDPRGP